MALCISCSTSIENDDQSYVVSDMGFELYSLLPDRIEQEIAENSALCIQCFEELTRRLARNSNQPLSSAHDINLCFACHASLLRRRSLVIHDGPEYRELARTIRASIPLNARVCYACWFRANRNLQRQNQFDVLRNNNDEVPGPSTPPLIITNRCVLCDVTLFGRRTHMLAEGMERNHISARIHPREIPPNARVCHACWSAVQRRVQRERDDQELVADHEIQPQSPNSEHGQEFIHLDDVRRVRNTSTHCFVPGCRNVERRIVPMHLKKRLLSAYNIYIPKYARVCQEHRVFYNWEFLQEYELFDTFTKHDIHDIIQISNRVSFIHLNFNYMEGMDTERCQFWLGVTVEQFLIILAESNIQCSNPRVALGIYLLKLRTGEPIRRIASLIRMAPSQICKFLNIARRSLLINFVPRHLGLQHLSRRQLLEKNLLIPEGLFGGEEKAIIICDGTYIYIQKSSNYCFKKKTYSLHKYRNLVKPLLFVATDGYILDVFGPYGATESDSDIMTALFQNENHPLRSYFQEEDVFILDRGFRDSLPLLRRLGYSVYKPESLPEGETQLPTLAVNRSRCVTLCRWVVEVVNGRFKRDFKIFRSEYFNLASRHFMVDFRIAAALINAFHRTIENRPDAALILRRALERLNLSNYLAEYVIINNINRRRANFRNIDVHHGDLNSFPEMTMSDLILFSLGIYQIKQARSYYGEHIRQNGTFLIEIADVELLNVPIPEATEGALIRGRIRSRHQSGRVYYTYILLVEGDSWEEKIKGYYCSCVCGKRTVGCCAHTMTLVWYLGWARHQENIEAPASFLDGVLVREDIDE